MVEVAPGDAWSQADVGTVVAPGAAGATVEVAPGDTRRRADVGAVAAAQL
jgi:hypothetical protein